MLHSGLARVPADRKVLFLGRCESPNLLQRGIESLRIAHNAATAKLINADQNRLQLPSQSYYFPLPQLSSSPKQWSRAGAGRNVLVPYDIYSFLEDFFEGLCREVCPDLTKLWWRHQPGGQISATTDQQLPRGWTHPGFPSWEGAWRRKSQSSGEGLEAQQRFCCSRCSQLAGLRELGIAEPPALLSGDHTCLLSALSK